MSALSEGTGGRFLLLAGDSLEEPVAWHGPLVMNTQEEIATAVDDYRSGRMGRIQRGM
jgi:redox-sensitive bicupin YhaK (pirin superfamily)